MEEVEATNYQYIIRCKDPPDKKMLFMNNVNSYLGCNLLKKVLSSYKEDENLFYEVFGTLCKLEKLCPELRFVNVLESEDVGFLDKVTECDIIIFDIGIGRELAVARKFLKHFEQQLESSRVDKKKQVILLSTIMTWAQTESLRVVSDSSYRKRKPHPCFTNHFSLERDFINLSRKFQETVSSVVICPGIVYGGYQDILHFVYKKSYFNSFHIEIFAPGTNYLPLIYIEDFSKIVIDVIRNPPDLNTPYILAVQPQPLKATSIISSIAEAIGGPEMRVKICSREEIFLMDEELMTQRVFNHLILNLRLESDFLKNFNFEITGTNFDENCLKIADEFHHSRGLKTLKILIDGSPYTYQSEMAEMFATFYSLHQIHSECFLENFCQRLIIKIKEAEHYQQHIKSMDTSEKLLSGMIEKVEGQIIEWRQKLDIVTDRLNSNTQTAFHEIQECVINRLTSFGCSKHQGFVMDGFELDSEMASYLFLEPSQDGFEFNEATKPDYVILLNRVVENDDLCADLEGKMKITDEVQKDCEMKTKLKKYHDSHYDDVSLINFFLDRDVIPIEITFHRDQSISELQDIFESLKSKIGSPRNYGLTKSEQEEILNLKMEIERKESEKKSEDARQKAVEDLEKKEEMIKDWTQKMLEKKRMEVAEIEKESLPTRHYLMKYVLPNITAGLTEVAKTRPKNAIDFLARFMLAQASEKIGDDSELDEEVVSEFHKIVKSTKCE